MSEETSIFDAPEGTKPFRALFSGAVLAAGLLAASCGGDGSSDDRGSGLTFSLNEVGNGFGQLLPHLVRRLDENGQQTGELIAIRSVEDVVRHVRRSNPVLAPGTFLPGAVSPNGSPGNHFLFANFTQAVDPATVLNPSPTGGALSGAVAVTISNPFTGTSLAAQGRAFVGGRTLVAPAPGSSSNQNVLEQWVRWDEETGTLVAVVPEAEGFPGVGSSDPSLRKLVSAGTVVFVADSNNDLSSFEAFPTGVQVRMRISSALLSTQGEPLQNSVLAASTVGVDELPPEIITTPAPAEAPLISPGNGDLEVDPTTDIRFEFTEPIQPYSLGPIGTIPASLDTAEVVGESPNTSSAVALTFGQAPFTTEVPFTVLPLSPYDLSTMIVSPAFSFPGRGPSTGTCGVFSRVNIDLSTQQIEDLAQVEDPNQPGQFIPNTNNRPANTFFETGEGVGIANAPVTPDAIYVMRSGAVPGISVLDLNGFGQSSGNPLSSPNFPLEGESRFPFDPNVTLNPTVRPLLRPGECTVDGGSAGVFTLTLDSGLQDLLVRAPLVSLINDVHTGHALDSDFFNAPPPFGCQASGGYICASNGVKIISPIANNAPNTLQPAQQNQFGALNPGYENLASWAPHPNPPRINYPPLCVSPFLQGIEPTSVDSTNNQLVTANPFPNVATQTPPTGLLTQEQNQFFLGPSVGQTLLGNCTPYQIRQQVGHYLYIADRPRSEVVVVNSNRMTVIDRIPVPDPTSMAMGPNIDVLAVSNQLADTVSFIDVNPDSSQFHRVIKTVQVGNSPRGIAFEPTNEDIIVCNELSNSITIVAASDLNVRREITSQLNRPFELAITPRMLGFSFGRQVYFAYILNRTGNVALFESGPNGLNGWGFDDVIGIIPFDFQAPKTVQLDPINLDASVYIVHEGPIDPATGDPGNLGDGAISRLRIESGPAGAVPISGGNFVNPNFRDAQFSVPLSASQSQNQLSGIPVDLAFDNLRNLAGAPTSQDTNPFAAGNGIPANNKSQIRLAGTASGTVGLGQTRNANAPQFLFAAVPNPIGGSGVIDVLSLGATGSPRFDTNPYMSGVQSVPVPLVTGLSDYFRQ